MLRDILINMCDYLSQKNPNARDIGVSLEESTHLYNINGDFNYMSVTTWNNRHYEKFDACLLYTSPSPRDRQKSRMPSSA